MRVRIPFAATLYAAGVRSTESQLTTDIQRFLRWTSSAEIASAYRMSPPVGRALFAPAIAELQPERQRAIRRAIEALGLKLDESPR